MVCFKVLKVTKLRYVRLSYSEAYSLLTFVGDSAAVGVIASHQYGTGWIPGPGVICGLSLLLVLYSAPRSFSPVFKFHFDLDYCQAFYHEPLARVIAQALPVFDIKFLC